MCVNCVCDNNWRVCHLFVRRSVESVHIERGARLEAAVGAPHRHVRLLAAHVLCHSPQLQRGMLVPKTESHTHTYTHTRTHTPAVDYSSGLESFLRTFHRHLYFVIRRNYREVSTHCTRSLTCRRSHIRFICQWNDDRLITGHVLISRVHCLLTSYAQYFKVRKAWLRRDSVQCYSVWTTEMRLAPRDTVEAYFDRVRDTCPFGRAVSFAHPMTALCALLVFPLD